MVVKKFNYYRFTIFIVILAGIIYGSITLINKNKYEESYDYKLSNIGYSSVEIKNIKDKLNNTQINKILTIKYDENINKFINEKYFIFNNLNKYLEYKDKNDKTDYTKTIAIINTESNVEWIDESFETDTAPKELMLVNRLYGLSKDYVPDDIVDVPSLYAYSGKKISKSILDKIISLIQAGKEVGYTFVVSDGYRSYADQEKLYNNYANSYGIEDADKVVARAGHSEYQTGISFDLMPYNKVIEDVSTNEEYLWLKQNAYKYGFIFRFEKEKEDLTLFKASSWRLRYVGEEAASIIYGEKICFEEYYAYFVRGKLYE